MNIQQLITALTKIKKNSGNLEVLVGRLNPNGTEFLLGINPPTVQEGEVNVVVIRVAFDIGSCTG